MARVRLFVFPYAGGAAAAVRGWSVLLGSEIEVQPVRLPGRDNLVLEPPLRSYPEALEYLRRTLFPLIEEPFAFYGHSMGAHLAFEAVRELRRLGRAGPLALFVSGAGAPRLGPPRPFAGLPDRDFVDRLRILGGTPPEVFAHDELLRFYLPLLRADFALAESYAYVPEEPLECPISVWGGLDDGHPRERLDAWRAETAGEFALRMLPGGHFFVRDYEAELVGALERDLANASRPLLQAR